MFPNWNDPPFLPVLWPQHGRAWKLPVIHSVSPIVAPVWMNGSLWLLSVSPRCLWSMQTDNPDASGNRPMHGSVSQWPRRPMPADANVRCALCVVVDVIYGVYVSGSWSSPTPVCDQAPGPDRGAGTHGHLPMRDQREPAAGGLLAERGESGKNTRLMSSTMISV